MEEKQFDRTKLYVPVKFGYTTLFRSTLGTLISTILKSMIAEIEHSVYMHSAAAVKRMFCYVIL